MTDSRWMYPVGNQPATPEDAFRLFRNLPGFDEPDLHTYLGRVGDNPNASHIMNYVPDRDGYPRPPVYLSSTGQSDMPAAQASAPAQADDHDIQVTGVPIADKLPATADPWTMNPRVSIK